MDPQTLVSARAATPEFPDKPLDESRNEIRVLSLLPQDALPLSSLGPDGNEVAPEFRDLVHYTIEHVSLDAVVPSYKSFTSQLTPLLSRRNTDENWRTFSNDRHRAKSPELTPLVRVRSHSRYHRFAWGDNGAVVLNGFVINVGRNLEAALRALSVDPDYLDGLRLWADAICINQRDLDERSRQVKRMGDIFGLAFIVSIWLGNCHDDAAANAVTKKVFVDGNPAAESLAVDAIDVLAHASYWSRVWTIQEKCLGPVNPSILFGSFRFALVPLQRFLSRATNIRGAERLREVEPVSPEELAERRRSDADDLNLLLTLRRLGGAVDVRDKLYGLMGMIPEDMARHIEPDYSKPVAEVFSDFVRVLATGLESFDLILTGTSETDLTLPSWVPDLTDTWDPYLWGTDCCASGGWMPQFHVEGPGGGKIIAKGFQVDAVDGTAPYLGWASGVLSVWKDAV
ncbi:hypothetical protein ACJ41O_010174 [Fusarium nematophilum]